jgi:hypothetical protein
MVRQRIRPVLRQVACDFYPPDWLDRYIWMEGKLKRTPDKRPHEPLSVNLLTNSYTLKARASYDYILEDQGQLSEAYLLFSQSRRDDLAKRLNDAAFTLWRIGLAHRLRNRHLDEGSYRYLANLSLAELESAIWPTTNHGLPVSGRDHLEPEALLLVNLIFDKFNYPAADRQLLVVSGWTMANTPRDEDRVYDDDDHEEDER